jgi:hypothetical protein
MAGAVAACGDPAAPEIGGDDPEPAACDELRAAPMRRLSRFEYDNTVRDLLGTSQQPAREFPPDVEIDGFDNAIDGLTVSRLHAEAYQRAAESLAAEAVHDLDALLPCDPAAPACADVFVRSFTRRAYRRPPSDDEVARLLAVHANGSDFADGVALVIEVVLQAPQFLYRLELGTPNGAPVSDHELATRLSYLLWGSMPDDALSAAADAAELRDDDGIALHTARLLADPRARDNVAHFHRQWLELDDAAEATKDPERFPDWSPDLAADLQDVADDFVAGVFWDGGNLRDLLTREHAIDHALYPDRRPGLLAHPALLAALAKPDQTHPIARGKFVREQLLCQPPPPPPPDVDNAIPAPDPDLSTRERFAEHSADPQCAACHQLLDPIGFGLEHYDAIGRFRDREAGAPIDASGTLLGTDVDGPFVGAAELAARLADSELVSRCTVIRWFTYAHGRAPTDADACTIEELQREFEDADQSLVALVVALTRTDAFARSP